MKKYKYKREERLNKFEWDLDYSLEHLLKDLLATISKEEQSQRIMMEQVPKEKTYNHNPQQSCDESWSCTKCHFPVDVDGNWGKCSIPDTPKQDKPVEKDKEIECTNCFYNDSGKCPPCSSHYSGFKPKCHHNRLTEINPNRFVCNECGMNITNSFPLKSPPIKDTNKTSLEVPIIEEFDISKTYSGKEFDGLVFLKINKLIRNQKKIIDYLTLISLDKKV